MRPKFPLNSEKRATVGQLEFWIESLQVKLENRIGHRARARRLGQSFADLDDDDASTVVGTPPVTPAVGTGGFDNMPVSKLAVFKGPVTRKAAEGVTEEEEDEEMYDFANDV